MPKLTDLDTILLSAAAARDGRQLAGSSEPDRHAARVHKALTVLLNRGLAEERETRDNATTFRRDGDLALAVVITDTGYAAIGAEPPMADAATPIVAKPAPPALAESRATKTSW